MSETETERNEAINTMDAERAIKILSDDAGNTEYDDFVNALDLAISALKQQSEAERVKETSANRLTQRNSLGRAVLIQEFMCGRCDEVYWSIGEITDRLAYFEENQSESERKIERIMEWCLSDQEVASTSENIGMERAQCDILDILEGKAE